MIYRDVFLDVQWRLNYVAYRRMTTTKQDRAAPSFRLLG